MSATVGALATAVLLGVTHAVEPDHVAGISSLTSEYGDPRLSALAGACFSIGHVVLVIVWLTVAYAVFGRTEFPGAFDAAGTVGVGVVLGVLGAAMAVGGARRILSTAEHDHGDTTHRHPHLTVSLPGFADGSRDHGTGHDHGAVAYLKTGVVGALFTLSPPVSMLVFASTLLPDFGPTLVAAAVAAYALAITATMSLLGAGTGALFGASRGLGRHAHASVQTLAGVAIAVLAASLLVDATGVLL